jgi:hypothetical protein
MANVVYDPRVAAAVKSGRKILKEMKKKAKAKTNTKEEPTSFVSELHTLIDKSDDLFQQIKKTIKTLED